MCDIESAIDHGISGKIGKEIERIIDSGCKSEDDNEQYYEIYNDSEIINDSEIVVLLQPEKGGNGQSKGWPKDEAQGISHGFTITSQLWL